MSFLDSVLIFEISLIFQRFVTDFVNWFIMENHRQWYLRDILTDILWHFRLSIDLFMIFVDLQWFSLTHFHTDIVIVITTILIKITKRPVQMIEEKGITLHWNWTLAEKEVECHGHSTDSGGSSVGSNVHRCPCAATNGRKNQ